MGMFTAETPSQGTALLHVFIPSQHLATSTGQPSQVLDLKTECKPEEAIEALKTEQQTFQAE